MKRLSFLLATLSIPCIIIGNAGAQTASPDKFPATDDFVGSTPCDAFIKSLLKIEADVTCEFIKWKLSLYKNQANADAFKVSVLYGESQPNTNGFRNGGKKLEVIGEFTVSHGMNENPYAKVYHLNGKNFQSPILLAKMDNNILHFLDREEKFIVGNGGWGYVLNRMRK